MTIEERLDNLKRELSRAKRRVHRLLGAVGLCAVIGIIVWIFGLASTRAQAAGGALKEVVANKFVLEDENGKMRAVLYMAKGEPWLWLFDKKGEGRVTLGINELGPGLRLCNEEGNMQAGLSVPKEGPTLELVDGESKARALLTVGKEKQRLEFFDKNGKPVPIRLEARPTHGWLLKNLVSLLNLVALIGLSLWGRAWVINKKGDLEEKIETLKTSHSKELYIHKLQFEKEFDVYWYLWMRLAHFKREAAKYFGIFPAIEDKSDFYDSFREVWKDVYETITIREPFIAEEVSEQTKGLIQITSDFLAKYKNPMDAEPDELKKIRNEVQDICAGIEKAIRTRINNICTANLIA